jgi:hypothetical protein
LPAWIFHRASSSVAHHAARRPIGKPYPSVDAIGQIVEAGKDGRFERRKASGRMPAKSDANRDEPERGT